MNAADLPDLPTLHRRPSWVNSGRAARPDRSGCLELRASELRRPRANNPIPLNGKKRSEIRGQRSEKKVRPFREARHTLYLTYHDLFHFHRSRMPFTLIGDHRTPKSNAMKRPCDPARRRKHLLKHEKPYRAPKDNDDIQFWNPNKGATATKVIPIPENWRQEVTLERWRQNPWLAHHYLICPDCHRKCKKLFMPLCTPDELADANFVRFFLKSQISNPRFANSPGTPLEAQLIDRYGPLFNPRLRCRKCLGVRYGYARFSADPKEIMRKLRRKGWHDLTKAEGAKLRYEHGEFERWRDWSAELAAENPNAPEEPGMDRVQRPASNVQRRSPREPVQL